MAVPWDCKLSFTVGAALTLRPFFPRFLVFPKAFALFVLTVDEGTEPLVEYWLSRMRGDERNVNRER
jgi:hypothetical protein